MSSVCGRFLGGKCAVFEDCKTVGDIMLDVARREHRLASDVVVLRAGSSQVLTHDAAAPPVVSIALKNEEEEREAEEWNTNIILYARAEDALTVAYSIEMFTDLKAFPSLGTLLEGANDEVRHKMLRTFGQAGFCDEKGIWDLFERSDFASMQSLFREGIFQNEEFEENRQTRLAFAVEGGEVKKVQALINARAEVDCEKNLLWRASRMGHKEVVQILLDARASPDGTELDEIPLRCTSCADVARILIDAQADINFVSFEKTTLYEASAKGRKEVVQVLLDADAEVNFQRDDTATALLAACENSHADVVQLLIDALADINIVACTGWGALDIALAKRCKKAVQILIDLGCPTFKKVGESALVKAE